MQPPAKPQNERQRLAALLQLGVLDTPPEPAYDDLGELARTIAGTTIGVISLVDAKRQWFKCAVGLDPGVRETSRDVSFCGHAILQSQPLVVSDALNDPRFHDNPLVIGDPHIRFYAGIPLISRSGFALGTLCVIDREPRQLSVSQLSALERLARVVVRQLEQEAVRSSGNPQWLAAGSTIRPGHTLLNRAQFAQMLEANLALADGGPFALLRCRFHDYERVSATLGGSVAERMIEEAARRLSHAVPRDASLARFSDAELMLLVPHVGDPAGVGAMAQRVLDLCEEPFRLPPHRLSLALAIGIALGGEQSAANSATADNLFSDTAMALRLASRSSKGGYRFSDAQSRAQASTSYRLESAFREAVAEGQLAAWYQPIVELATGQPVGFEALARWPQSDGSLLTPQQFLDIASETGLGGELDLQVIEKALIATPLLARAAPWRQMRLSVNLSATLLDDPLLQGRLIALLDRHPLPKEWILQVELLEEAFQHGSREFEAFLDELVERRVAIAIDDFGTGYSSLARLNSLPIHSFKIDRSFVAGIDHARRPSNTLLRSLGSLAGDLNLATTAEGAETEEQRRWLLERGFKHGQGFLFAEPMPFEDALAYLQEFQLQPAAIPAADRPAGLGHWATSLLGLGGMGR